MNDDQALPRAQAGGLDEVTSKEEEELSSDSASQAMKIAWRYRNMPKVQSSFSNQFGHNYDLTVAIPTARVEAVDRVHFNARDKPAKYVCTC